MNDAAVTDKPKPSSGRRWLVALAALLGVLAVLMAVEIFRSGTKPITDEDRRVMLRARDYAAASGFEIDSGEVTFTKERAPFDTYELEYEYVDEANGRSVVSSVLIEMDADSAEWIMLGFDLGMNVLGREEVDPRPCPATLRWGQESACVRLVTEGITVGVAAAVRVGARVFFSVALGFELDDDALDALFRGATQRLMQYDPNP